MRAHHRSFLAITLGCLALMVALSAVIRGQSRVVASAGPNQTIESIGITVHLDGSGSSGPATLAYLWTFLSVPAGSTAPLVAANTVAPTFVPDRPGRYRIRLTVQSGGRAANDTVTVTVNDRPPVANAGSDQAASVGQVVRLDGRASSDPDG